MPVSRLCGNAADLMFRPTTTGSESLTADTTAGRGVDAIRVAYRVAVRILPARSKVSFFVTGRTSHSDGTVTLGT